MNDCSLQVSDSSQPDFAVLDRRERRIQWHMLGGMAAGLLLGAVGPLAAAAGPGPVPALVTPLLVAVMLIVGRVSLSFGWAAMNIGLTAAGLVCGHLVVATLRGESPLEFPFPGSHLNGMLVLLVLCGLLAHFARLENVWGDAAAGPLALLVAASVLRGAVAWDRLLVLSNWPWAALAAVAFGLLCVAPLRSHWAGRLRAAGVAGTVAAVYMLGSGPA